MVYRIVYTGGPCAGKSLGLPYVKRRFEAAGFNVVSQWEAATPLIQAGLPPFGYPCDRLAFQIGHLELQMYNEDLIDRMVYAKFCDAPVIVLQDRGLADFRAYVTPEDEDTVLGYLGLNIENIFDRYNRVVHMTSAAVGAEEFYTLANNTARTESLEMAKRVDQLTWQAYEGHHDHIRIDNSTDFEEKLERTFTASVQGLTP